MARSTVFMIRALMPALLTMSLAAHAAEPPAPQAGYTSSTLREPVYDFAETAVHTVKLNNWLNENYASLDEARKTAARERLYYLIDSQIKHNFARTQRVLPAGSDLQLALLFSWAERLGVYGGNLVFNQLKTESMEPAPTSLELPPGIRLSLHGDLFELESDTGWQVSFPYYFMIGAVRDMVNKDGARSQLVIISTGTAKDSSKSGRSQATLMLVFSPGAALPEFKAFWQSQIPIRSDDESIALGVRGLTSQKNFEEKLKLHREMVAWSAPKGACAVVYLGNDGTYQWNRPHFIDFVSAVRTN